MRSSRRVAVALCATAMGSGAAWADATLEFATQGGGPSNVIQVKGDTVRMNQAGQSDFYSIFDASEGTLTHVNARKGQYYQMDAESVKAMTRRMEEARQRMLEQMRQQMAEMSGEEKQRLQQQLAHMQGREEAPEMRVEKTGRSQTVNDFKCEIMELYQGDERVGRVCVADRSGLGKLPKDDYQTLLEFADFTQHMSEVASETASSVGGAFGGFQATKIEGIPIRMSAGKGEQVVELKQIKSESLPGDLFTIPDAFEAFDPTAQAPSGAQGQPRPSAQQPQADRRPPYPQEGQRPQAGRPEPYPQEGQPPQAGRRPYSQEGQQPPGGYRQPYPQQGQQPQRYPEGSQQPRGGYPQGYPQRGQQPQGSYPQQQYRQQPSGQYPEGSRYPQQQYRQQPSSQYPQGSGYPQQQYRQQPSGQYPQGQPSGQYPQQYQQPGQAPQGGYPQQYRQQQEQYPQGGYGGRPGSESGYYPEGRY